MGLSGLTQSIQPFDDPGVPFNNGDPIRNPCGSRRLLRGGRAELGLVVLGTFSTDAVELQRHNVGTGADKVLRSHVGNFARVQPAIIEETFEISAGSRVAVAQVRLGTMQKGLLFA